MPDFFSFFFPCSADHEQDWLPFKVVFFGLVSNQYAECEKQHDRGKELKTIREFMALWDYGIMVDCHDDDIRPTWSLSFSGQRGTKALELRRLLMRSI